MWGSRVIILKHFDAEMQFVEVAVDRFVGGALAPLRSRQKPALS